MKKSLLKLFFLGIVVTSYFFVEPVQAFLTPEINMSSATRFFARSFYDDTKAVAEVPLVVKDYMVVSNRLYIFPLDDKVSLPIDVMIVKVEYDTIEVVDYDRRFTIHNLTKRSKNLYQYVPSLNEFGTTDDFFIVEGEELDCISQRLLIYYEKV